MKFGRGSPHTAGELPENDPRTLEVLAAAPTGQLAAFAGCPTWANKEWLGSIYPADATDLLVAYGRAFNGMELNVTHYRIPDAATVERWRRSVPDDFRFAVKMPQRASHEGDLGAARQMAQVARGFGEKLGCLFLQLPPSFAPGRADELRALFGAIAHDLPLVVELRHRAWFAGGKLTPFAWDLLAERKASAVITDAPGRPDVLHSSLGQPLAFVRFLATMDDAVDNRRLDAWAARIAAWRAAGLHELYFWLHAPDNVGAPALVKAFKARFEAKTGQSLRTAIPPPGQMSLL